MRQELLTPEISKKSTHQIDDEDEKINRDSVKRFRESKINIHDAPTSDDSGGSITLGLGHFLEMHQMQSFVVGVIVIDSFASFSEIYLLNLIGRKTSILFLGFASGQLLLSAIQSLTTFTLAFYVLELLATLVVFKTEVVGHPGYGLDIIIVMVQLYLEVVRNIGRESRIMNIFRLWRCIRLFNSVVNKEKKMKKVIAKKCSALEVDCKNLKAEIQRFEINLLKEKVAKNAVEDMLQVYKEEVDTLNEALKIAAMDIAEVAQAEDDFSTDEDDEDVDFVDASTSQPEKKGRCDTLLLLARQDLTTSRSVVNSRTTFVVKEDGSIEKR